MTRPDWLTEILARAEGSDSEPSAENDFAMLVTFSAYAVAANEDRLLLAALCESLAEAAQVFVEAWERSHQLEKTDVALRKCRKALAAYARGEPQEPKGEDDGHQPRA